MQTNGYHSGIGFQDVIQPWIEWKHISMGRTHCPTCLKLDKCWFVKANMPMLPQHEYCHCTAIPKSCLSVQRQAKAISPYDKFTNYLLNANNPRNKGKAAMFESWGYSKKDSAWLAAEFERQAREKYTAGEYVLGELNQYGQRINIQITIPHKDGKGNLLFRTGWITQPNGTIQLVTPYGGKQ